MGSCCRRHRRRSAAHGRLGGAPAGTAGGAAPRGRRAALELRLEDTAAGEGGPAGRTPAEAGEERAAQAGGRWMHAPPLFPPPRQAPCRPPRGCSAVLVMLPRHPASTCGTGPLRWSCCAAAWSAAAAASPRPGRPCWAHPRCTGGPTNGRVRLRGRALAAHGTPRTAERGRGGGGLRDGMAGQQGLLQASILCRQPSNPRASQAWAGSQAA